MSLPFLHRHERTTRPPYVAVLRLGLDFVLFTSVLFAWPALRLGRIALGRRHSR